MPLTQVSKSMLEDVGLAQCRLVKSGANLVLQQFGGDLLTIAGVPQSIPGAGVSLAPTSATPGTTYFIYAYMNAGTMALEYSTTSYSTAGPSGMYYKTGDNTRTLVGMARCVTGPAWADSGTQRLVVSFYNRRKRIGQNVFTSDIASSATSFTELSSTMGRIEFMLWADEGVEVHSTAYVVGNATSNSTTAIGFDGTTPEDGSQIAPASAGTITVSAHASRDAGSLSEGYHYATLLGVNSSANSTSWKGAAAITNSANRCSIHLAMQG